MAKVMNMLKLTFRTSQLVQSLWPRLISTKKIDPLLLQNVRNKIDDNKTFEEINFKTYEHGLSEMERTKVMNVIDMYDQMKYNLQEVPSTITVSQMKHIIALKTSMDVKRYIKKLYHMELDRLAKKEIQNCKKALEESSDDAKRAGIFDVSGKLTYGLWHNTMFIRVKSSSRQRFYLERQRIAHQFGQHLYIDFGFSHELTYHKSQNVANDLAHLIKLNRIKLVEPYRLIFCNVNYQHSLWKLLETNFAELVKYIEHTDKCYTQLCQDKSKLVYVSNMVRNNHLEYDGDHHYVLAAVSEKDMSFDFLTPIIRKAGIPLRGFPLDKHIVWRTGSKRFNLTAKSKIIDHLKFDNNWSNALRANIHKRSIKDEQEILCDDKLRIDKLQYKTKIKTKNTKNGTQSLSSTRSKI